MTFPNLHEPGLASLDLHQSRLIRQLQTGLKEGPGNPNITSILMVESIPKLDSLSSIASTCPAAHTLNELM